MEEDSIALDAPAAAMTGAFRNAWYSAPDRIDLEFEHPRLGWIPITISEEDYPELWAQVVVTDPTPYVPPVPPTDAELRAAWRPTAMLTRAAFCTACRILGILPPEEAIAAAKRDWPPSFTPVLSLLPEGMDPVDVQILWASVNQIERLHPLFEILRQFHGMSNEQADTMFGYQG